MFRNLRSAGLALAFAAIAVAPAVPAFAGESNGPAFGSVAVTTQPAMPDVGQGYRANTAFTSYVQSGGLLPSGSNSQGEPQSANSLPQGFYNGTPVMQHREALQNYWSSQGRPSSVAGLTFSPRG